VARVKVFLELIVMDSHYFGEKNDLFRTVNPTLPRGRSVLLGKTELSKRSVGHAARCKNELKRERTLLPLKEVTVTLVPMACERHSV